MRYTYAFSLARKFNQSTHAYCETAWFDGVLNAVKLLEPLVQRGETVTVNETRKKADLQPAEESQTEVHFTIYRTSLKIPMSGVAARVSDKSLPSNIVAVPSSAALATVVVNVGPKRHTGAKRTCSIALKFGGTEITAEAFSDATGDRQAVNIRYE